MSSPGQFTAGTLFPPARLHKSQSSHSGNWGAAFVRQPPNSACRKSVFAPLSPVFTTSKSCKNDLIERAGALCPLHPSPAALARQILAYFFDSLNWGLILYGSPQFSISRSHCRPQTAVETVVCGCASGLPSFPGGLLGRLVPIQQTEGKHQIEYLIFVVEIRPQYGFDPLQTVEECTAVNEQFPRCLHRIEMIIQI